MPGPIVITGGGTGGHVFPMQAIAEQLGSRGIASGDLRFVGSRRGQEATLLASSGVTLTLLPGRGLQRSLRPAALLDNAGAVLGLFAAVGIAIVKVGRWRPSAVVSVGGYASFAVTLAAVLWRRPLIVVELDATPGAAHRLLGHFAASRCTAFPSLEANSVLTGAPVREEIVMVDRSPGARRVARSLADPPIDEDSLVVVVMTGSLGSARVNHAVSGLAARWAERADRTLIHVTGRRDFDSIVRARPGVARLDYRIVEFSNMASLWSIADVAVCRAGATTVAELTLLGIPSILVPLPNAPGDHQSRNAAAVVAAGGARLVVDEECTASRLDDELGALCEPAVRDAMSVCARTLGHPDAAEAIARAVVEVARWS